MYGVAIRLGLVTAAAVLAGCAARREDDSQPVSNDPSFTPDPPDTDTPPVDSGETGDPITSQAYSDVQNTYDADLDGYLTETNATQLQQAINDGYVTVDETGEAALALIEQGKYDCNDSPTTGFYTFPAAPQRLTMNQINDCDATDIEIELGEDAMVLSGTANYSNGDIDGDGNLDIILAGSLDSNKGLYVFTNPSNVFGPGQSFDEALATYTVAEGESVGYPQIKDVTGDGQADLVFVSYLVSGGGLHMIPGPITSSLTLTSSDFSNSDAVAARGWSVVKPDNLGAYFLTADMDGYEPEVGEVVMQHAAGAYVFPAIFEPGVREWSDFTTEHPYYNFYGPMYSSIAAVMPDAGNIDGDDYIDLSFGDVAYNYSTLVRGGTELLNYARKMIEVDDADDTRIPHWSGGVIHLADTSIKYNIFKGNEDEGAWDAGSAVSFGDVDGDGLADLSVGVSSEDANGASYAGCNYLIFGAGYTDALDSEELTNGENVVLNGDIFDMGGMAFCGTEDDMSLPWSGLSLKSDTDGDGKSDLSTGTVGYDMGFIASGPILTSYAGYRLATTSSEHTIHGEEGTEFGHKITGGIDFDNDGYEDIVVNAENINTDYILFGGPSN